MIVQKFLLIAYMITRGVLWLLGRVARVLWLLGRLQRVLWSLVRVARVL